MVEKLQGDVFGVERGDSSLTVVFGHVGYNPMRTHLDDYLAGVLSFPHVHDAFDELTDGPHETKPGRYLWFVKTKRNGGLSTADMTAKLDSACTWAVENNVQNLITNGVPDTGHGHVTQENRRLADVRAAELTEYATRASTRHGISVVLCSLSDVFVR